MNATLTENLFEMDFKGPTLVLTPVADLREFDEQQIETGAAEVLKRFDDGTFRNVVVDFRLTDYFGSTALGFFVQLWGRVRRRGGHMAFCNLSGHEMEILTVAHLMGIWSVCPSREEALAAVAC
jgi:anti-anti-sigma factor